MLSSNSVPLSVAIVTPSIDTLPLIASPPAALTGPASFTTPSRCSTWSALITPPEIVPSTSMSWLFISVQASAGGLNVAFDVDTKDECGNTVLDAAECGNSGIFRLLVAKCNKTNQKGSTGETALHIATHNNHADSVRLLLDRVQIST